MMWMYVLVGGLLIAVLLLAALWFRCHDAYVGLLAVSQNFKQIIDEQDEELVTLRQSVSRGAIASDESHRLMLVAREELLKAHGKMAVMEMRDKILSESMAHKIEVFKIMLKSPVTSDKEKEELIAAAEVAKQVLTMTKHQPEHHKHDIGGEG